MTLNNEGMKDERVPTFIAFEQSPKKTGKRKRSVKGESSPNKKKTLKGNRNGKAHSTKSEESFVNQIWIGAVVDKKNGAFSVYFGENDERNYSEAFVRKSIAKDTDYGHCLGILKALEVTQPSSDSSFLVNVTARDLCTAIREKTIIVQYEDLLEKMYSLMKKRKQRFQVNHVSGRHAPHEQKEALIHAMRALKNFGPPMEKVYNAKELHFNVPTNNKDTQNPAGEISVIDGAKGETVVEKEVKEDVVDEVTTTVTSTEETNDKLQEIVSKTDDLQKIQEAVQEAVVGDNLTNVVVETTVETTVETKVEVKVIEPEEQDESGEVQPMEVVEEEGPAPPTGASSWFGIRGIFDFISNPFRSRKTS